MIWLLIGYMFLFIHRPFEVWPILGTLRLELIYMLFAGSVWLIQPGKQFRLTGINLALAAFASVVLLSGLASFWSSDCQLTVENFFKMLVFYLMLVTTVRDERDLKRVVLGFVAVMALYVSHSFWEFLCGRHHYRMGIIRMGGVDVTGNNPNALAAAIVLSLPFLPVLWREASQGLRWFLAGYGVLAVGSVCLTGSRGGFVAMLACAGVMAARSRHRWSLGAAAVLAAPILWGMLSDQLQNRFTTIIDPSVGPANAQTSAEGRTIGLEIGYRLLTQYPLLGVGPGAWIPATGRELLSHNLYGQLMGELGMLGVLTFAAYVGCVTASIFWVRRRCPPTATGQSGFLYALAGAVGLNVFLLLLMGNVGHNLFRFNWYWYAAFMVIAQQIVLARQADWLAQADWLEDSDYPAEEWRTAEADLVEIA